MDAAPFTQSPFAVLTFIAAPAVLTNAASVLAMSTINRMLRTRDRMQELYEQSEKGVTSVAAAERLVKLTDRVERQAAHLLTALHSIYVALAAFAAASLITLLGAVLGNGQEAFWFRIVAGASLLVGCVGVSGLIYGCVNLFQATRLSLENIHEEASLIRQQQESVRKKLSNPPPG